MDKLIGQPQLLKEVNNTIINRLIAEKGPLSKPQIAAIVGLSLPTVNKIVYNLESIGLIKEVGTTTGLGRKAVLYAVNEQAGNLLTLYLTNRSYTCCVVNMIGEVVYRFGMNICPDSKEQALQDTCQAIHRLMDNCSAPVLSIGIGISGVVDEAGFISSIPTIPGWEGFNLKSTLEELYHIPVYVENNVRLTTLGFYSESFAGDGTNMVYIHMGKGIASGIILEGRLYKGFCCFAGECGYMLTEELAKVPHQANKGGGHLEYKVSRIMEQLGCCTQKEQMLALKKELAIYITGVAVNYISILNPEVIVLGGYGIGKDFAFLIHELVSRYVPPATLPEILVDTAEMTGTKGIISMCQNSINAGMNIVKGNGI